MWGAREVSDIQKLQNKMHFTCLFKILSSPSSPYLSSRQRMVTLSGSLLASKAFTTLLCKAMSSSVSTIISSNFSSNSFFRNWMSFIRWSEQQNYTQQSTSVGLPTSSFAVNTNKLISYSLTKLLVTIILHAFALFVSFRDQPKAFCSEKLWTVSKILNIHETGSTTLLRTAIPVRHCSPLVVNVVRKREKKWLHLGKR